jgi:hypothetical protein
VTPARVVSGNRVGLKYSVRVMGRSPGGGARADLRGDGVDSEMGSGNRSP